VVIETEMPPMGYSIRTLKTTAGQYVARVETGSYGRGHCVHQTESFEKGAQAYSAAVQWRKDNAAKNAAIKADRLKAGMHCQCCGKVHLANNGLMAHHGYTRPGVGWQTASCYGARYVPFEVSRDRLATLIDDLRAYRKRVEQHLADVKADRKEIHVTFTDSRVLDKNKRYGKTMVSVTRDTWDAVKAENEPHAAYGTFPMDFESVKNRKLNELQKDIEATALYIKEQVKRFNGWKQTHKWDDANKGWVAL
jgi:hypothetical protein